MRKSFVASVAIVTILAIATPAAAASRDRDRDSVSVVKFLKSVAKKVFGIQPSADIVIPIPAPDKP